jgi:hypothetical protein
MYSTDATKNTSVESMKIVSSIGCLPSANLGLGTLRAFPRLGGTAKRYLENARLVSVSFSLGGLGRRLRLQWHHGDRSLSVQRDRMGDDDQVGVPRAAKRHRGLGAAPGSVALPPKLSKNIHQKRDAEATQN